MAANDYLKVAASQLRRAAEFLHKQSLQLSFEKTRITTLKTTEISRHQNEIRANQMTVMHNLDVREKAALVARSRMLEQQIHLKKDELKKITDQINNIARAKEQTAASLTGQARQLESQASQPVFNS